MKEDKLAKIIADSKFKFAYVEKKSIGTEYPYFKLVEWDNDKYGPGPDLSVAESAKISVAISDIIKLINHCGFTCGSYGIYGGDSIKIRVYDYSMVKFIKEHFTKDSTPSKSRLALVIDTEHINDDIERKCMTFKPLNRIQHKVVQLELAEQNIIEGCDYESQLNKYYEGDSPHVNKLIAVNRKAAECFVALNAISDPKLKTAYEAACNGIIDMIFGCDSSKTDHVRKEHYPLSKRMNELKHHKAMLNYLCQSVMIQANDIFKQCKNSVSKITLTNNSTIETMNGALRKMVLLENYMIGELSRLSTSAVRTMGTGDGAKAAKVKSIIHSSENESKFDELFRSVFDDLNTILLDEQPIKCRKFKPIKKYTVDKKREAEEKAIRQFADMSKEEIEQQIASIFERDEDDESKSVEEIF